MSNDAMRFTVEDGQITAIYKLDDHGWEFKYPDQNERWTSSNGQVTAAERDDGVTKMKVYTDADGDGVYFKTQETYLAVQPGTQSQPSGTAEIDHHDASVQTTGVVQLPGAGLAQAQEKYGFTLQGDSVAAAYEIEHGVQQVKRLDGNETYQRDGSDVLKIESKHNGQELTRYTDTDGNGLYVKVSEQWVGADQTRGPAPQITHALSFTGSDLDDDLALTASGSAIGGQGADRFVFRELGHVEIGDFDHGHGDKIVFDTGLGLTSLEQLKSYITDARYDGHTFEVDFGDQVSLKLVGIDPSQLAADDIVILS